MKRWIHRLIWMIAIGVVGVLLIRAFRPMPLLVDSARVARGDLVVTVDDDGRTRVRERYTISAPIGGRLLRTVLRPGDSVRATETVVAEFAPLPPSLLDARARAEAEAEVKRNESALLEAQARTEQALAEARHAEADLARERELVASRIRSPADLEAAETRARSMRENARAAQLAVQVAVHELELARASLVEPSSAELGERPRNPQSEENARAPRAMELRSPIDGRVLRVYEESARSLLAGTPILEVGNTSTLELVADYLTHEAVRVGPGMAVLVTGWGGQDPTGEAKTLHGRVRVVEPGGFTKVSALGVEEQRVNVLVDPSGDDQAWRALGDGYHVELRIVVESARDVLLVPTGALFRAGGQWAAFLIEEGLARRRMVEVGRRSSLEAEILEGLREGDRVILYPNELIAEETRVESR